MSQLPPLFSRTPVDLMPLKVTGCPSKREAAPCGGLMLGDGANVFPGTPLENLAVFVDAAEEYALGGANLLAEDAW